MPTDFQDLKALCKRLGGSNFQRTMYRQHISWKLSMTWATPHLSHLQHPIGSFSCQPMHDRLHPNEGACETGAPEGIEIALVVFQLSLFGEVNNVLGKRKVTSRPFIWKHGMIWNTINTTLKLKSLNSSQSLPTIVQATSF